MMRTYPRSHTANLPAFLASAKDLPSSKEREDCALIRRQFLFPNDPEPYMVDLIRAMRLIRGTQRYIEVGTYDKGCLAYISTLLPPGALLIDVDVEARPEHAGKLSNFVGRDKKLATVIGDSTDLSTLIKVKAALGDQLADAVFIDGNHVATFAWADFGNFLDLVKPGGLLFFHDVYWEGTADSYGVSKAMEWIDRVLPVHVVLGEHPVHRFFPMMEKNVTAWGGVGIIRNP
jgi:predicted O-methyltransferase YrrM